MIVSIINKLFSPFSLQQSPPQNKPFFGFVTHTVYFKFIWKWHPVILNKYINTKKNPSLLLPKD